MVAGEDSRLGTTVMVLQDDGYEVTYAGLQEELSVAAIAFAPGLIWTQSFMSGDADGLDTAVYFFRFFAIQILFYGLGSVFSGVLNAHRDYFWSNFAPVLNNVVVIASFVAYHVLLRRHTVVGKEMQVI